MYRWRVICYPWDLVDEGVEAVLDLLHGELGATDIVVPLVSGPMHMLRRRPAAAVRRLQTEGGCHFKPESRRYTACRAKPVASDAARENAFLTKLGQLCEERGLGFGVRISATSIPALAARHPEMCAKDVFGTPWNRLCVMNPETAEYLRLLSEEIRDRFAPEFVEWDDLFESATGIEAVSCRREISVEDELLLATCACPACRQIGMVAGLDTSQAIEAVRDRLDSVIQQRSADESGGSWLDRNEPFRLWVAAKRETYRGLLSSLRRAAGCDLDVRVPSLSPNDARSRLFLTRPGEGVSSLIESWTDAPASSTTPSPAADRGADAIAMGMQVPIYDRAHPDGAWLNAKLLNLASRGTSPVDLDHLGALPVTGQSAVRQAIRFARRH